MSWREVPKPTRSFCAMFALHSDAGIEERGPHSPCVLLPELGGWERRVDDRREYSREDVLDMVQKDILDGRLPDTAWRALVRLEAWCKALGGGEWRIVVGRRWVTGSHAGEPRRMELPPNVIPLFGRARGDARTSRRSPRADWTRSPLRIL